VNNSLRQEITEGNLSVEQKRDLFIEHFAGESDALFSVLNDSIKSKK
jgi:hypothetical protein